MYKLHDYQREAVDFHLKQKHSLNQFYMGLGKTLVAIDFVRQINKRATIVVPAYLKPMWRNEIEKFTTDTHLFHVTSYSQLGKLQEMNSVLVLEEAHYIKNPMTQRSKLLTELIRSCPPEYFLMMTGTPAKNNVSEWYNIIRLRHLLTPVHDFRFTSVAHFKNYFMNRQLLKMGGRKFFKYSGVKNADQLRYYVNQFRIKKSADDVDLPDMVNKKITGNAKKFNAQLEQIADNKADKAFMTAKKEVALASCESTLQLVDSFPAEEQVVIFTEHVDSVMLLGMKLNVPCVHGGIKAEDRQKIFEDFKAGKFQYLVATYKTAGTGLTLTNCRYMVLNDLPFVPGDIEQAKKRIHRQGQNRTCFYYYMFLSDMHERIYKTVLKKVEDLKQLD